MKSAHAAARRFPLVLLCALFLAPCSMALDRKAQPLTVSALFESQRQDPNWLRAFFLKMPKGADLHHHLSGSTYAEWIIENAKSDFCLDPNTLKISPEPCATTSVPFSKLESNQLLYDRLVDAWSTRNFEKGPRTGHDQFFATFLDFSPAITNYGPVLQELMQRAQHENLLYIETMTQVGPANDLLRKKNAQINLQEGFEACYQKIRAMPELALALQEVAEFLVQANEVQTQSESKVLIRYLYHALRVMELPYVFLDMVLAYEAAQRFPEILGVNLVGPEDYALARKDYHTHMLMLQFLNKKYPGTKVALHAGELVMGLVPPDDLRFHIREALELGNALRIGHGSDISYESDSDELLRKMQKIPVELALSSNEIILNLKGADHPLLFYKKHGVPICLASDDAGVGRTDLNEQYVMAAKQYPSLTYEDFKSFSRNSLEYAFLPGESIWKQTQPKWLLRAEFGDPKAQPSAKAKAFLETSEKAALQWELELRFRRFETQMAQQGD